MEKCAPCFSETSTGRLDNFELMTEEKMSRIIELLEVVVERFDEGALGQTELRVLNVPPRRASPRNGRGRATPHG